MTSAVITHLRAQVGVLTAARNVMASELNAITRRYEGLLVSSSGHCLYCGAPARGVVCFAHSDLIESDDLTHSRQDP